MELPHFIYHPDPVATGMFEAKSAICPCCEKRTEVVYATQPYCQEEVEDLCPWCIADGSAARKFEALFCDDAPLVDAGLKPEIIEEVATRTPGYISWQQDCWLTCCDDACEFHGDLQDLASLPADLLDELRTGFRLTEIQWNRLVANYRPGGSPSFYKFVCRHCRKIQIGTDCD